jgi:hypothetical protein
MPVNSLTRRVADEFKDCMAETLQPDELRAIDAENRKRSDATCASHDYCDANMVMNEAFERLELEVFGDDGMSEETVTLWNEAWDLAQSEGFYSPHD